MYHSTILLRFLFVLFGVTVQLSASSMTSDERHRMTKLQEAVEVLSKQLMMMQLSHEEMIKSDGDSGVKQIRLDRDGTRPYHSTTHSGRSVAAMHDHADMPRTCGMGEIEAVLNGVHFRTRHNDYSLRMPTAKGEYLGTEAIPFPAVPPAVLSQSSVEGQIEEMRQWFKAWRDDDVSTRDYRHYFIPVMCYLEGWWTTDVSLREPFLSERHHIDADDWQDLQEKIRFTSYTGDKDAEENLAFLPTMVLNITDGVPALVHWTYRILCHPLHHHLNLSDLKPIDDLGNRLATEDTWDDYVMSRAARFSLNPFSGEKAYRWSLLDKIMKHVPGLNGYGSRLLDKSMGSLKLQGHNDSPLNTAYYHRWYKLAQAGAMGEKIAHIGFADRNLFIAETTQPQVAPMSTRNCWRSEGGVKTCKTYTRQVTYAIPLEIVYLTPLHMWNPYNIEYKGLNQGPLGRTVTAGKRNGKLTQQEAFNGTNSRHLYHTPSKFFRSAKEVNSDPADTVKGVVGVLDQAGDVKAVVASGVRIFLPEIDGVGVVRTRYPVMPVYAEGNTAWKEVEALREVVMNMRDHVKYFRNTPSCLVKKQSEKCVGGSSSSSSSSSSPSSPSSSSLESASSAASGSSLIQKPTTVLKITSSNQESNSSGQEALLDNITFDENEGLILAQAFSSKNASDLAFIISNTPQPDDKRPKFEVPSHVTLVTSPSKRSYVPLHVHYVEVNRAQLYTLVKRGKRVTLRTTFDGGHSHLVALRFDKKTQYFTVRMCDDKIKCWDGHSQFLERIHSGSSYFNEKLIRFG